MIEPNDLVLVAVSGGPDSTALLFLLDAVKKELNIKLHVAHLNHNIRKNDAELDVRYVQGLAQRLKIPICLPIISGLCTRAAAGGGVYFSRIPQAGGGAQRPVWKRWWMPATLISKSSMMSIPTLPEWKKWNRRLSSRPRKIRIAAISAELNRKIPCGPPTAR